MRNYLISLAPSPCKLADNSFATSVTLDECDYLCVHVEKRVPSTKLSVIVSTVETVLVRSNSLVTLLLIIYLI